MSSAAAKMFFKINFTPSEFSGKPWLAREWNKARAFYTCNAEYNYFKYSLNGEKVVKNKDYLNYMQREDEEGNVGVESTGAFGLKGEYTKEELEQIKKELQATGSTIWHGFISFNTDLSKNFNSIDDCVNYLRPTFNVLIENSHLDKKNITAVFCLHEDTANRHIHFQFFEKKPTRVNQDGEVSYTKKGTIKQMAIDNFLVSSGLYFEDSKYQLSVARDEALDRLREVCPTARSLGQERYADGIAHQLRELAKLLPEKGRTAYRSSNMRKLRPAVDRVVNYIVNSDRELQDKVKAYYGEIESRKTSVVEMMKSQQFAYIKGERRLNKEDLDIIFEGKDKRLDPTKMHEWVDYQNIRVIDKLHDDLKARLGNYVIGISKSYKPGARIFVPTKRVFNRNNKSIKIAAQQDRKLKEMQLDEFLRNLKKSLGYVRTDFTYDLHKAEYEIERDSRETGDSYR